MQHSRYAMGTAAGSTGFFFEWGGAVIDDRDRRGPVLRQHTDPGRQRPRRCHAVCVRYLAATGLLFALALQSFDLRAELLFRSAEQAEGRQQWSALKRYADPAETAYPRTLADGAQISSEEVQIFLRGTITAEDVYGARVMESLVKRGSHRIAGNAISLAGIGGDVDAAMELGRMLRKLGVATFVAREEQCLSSCVFAFMGGDRRMVAGRVGIHRPYFDSTRKVPDRRGYYRQLQRRVQEYMEELDFPQSLYEAFMAVPSESISMLSAADLKKYYLQGMSPSAEEEADAAAARALGLSVLEYLRRKAQAQPCAGVFDSDGTCANEPREGARSGASAAVPSLPYEGAWPGAGGLAHTQRRDGGEPGPSLGTAEPR